MPTCQDLAKTSFSYENVFLQCSDSLSGAMSLTTSIARIAKVTQPKFLLNSQSFKDYGKPWNFLGGLQFVNIHGGGGFLFRKLKVSAGRCGRGRSRNPLLCLFSFVEKRDFSILDRSINIYWVFRWYNWLLLVKFRPWAALIRKAP